MSDYHDPYDFDPTTSLAKCEYCQQTYTYPSEEGFQDHKRRCLFDRENDAIKAVYAQRDIPVSDESSSTAAESEDEVAALQDLEAVLGNDPQGSLPQSDSFFISPEQQAVIDAHAAYLSPDWQKKYYDSTYRGILEATQVVNEVDKGFTLAAVGRAGAGKGSLINHLLDDAQAFVSDNAGNAGAAEYYMNTDHGRLRIKDVPGWDGPHHLKDKAVVYDKEKGTRSGWWPFGGKTAPRDASSAAGESDTKSLDVKAFLRHKSYGLLDAQLGAADAVMYVVDDRINPPAADIIKELVKHGKIVFLVFTKAERMQDFAKLFGADSPEFFEACKDRIGGTIANSLQTADNADTVSDIAYMLWHVPIFFVVTRITNSADLCHANPKVRQKMMDLCRQQLDENRATLDMPRLVAFLQHDLVPRLRLVRNVDAGIKEALKPFHAQVGWGTLFVEMGGNLAGQLAGTAAGGFVGGLVGSVFFMTISSMYVMLSMCDAVGLLPGTHNWRGRLAKELRVAFSNMHKVVWQAFRGEAATKFKTMLSTVLIAVFGALAMDLIDDIVLLAVAEGTVLAAIPVVGVVLYGSMLRKTRKRLAKAVEQLAIPIHRRWIMENIRTPHTNKLYA